MERVMKERRPSRASVFLTGLSTFLLFLAIGFGLLLLLGAVFGFGVGGNDVTAYTVVDSDRVADLPPGAIASEEFEVAVRIPNASAEQKRLFALRDLPLIITFGAALWLVRGLLRSVRDGSPFVRDNVNRLRILAVVVLVGFPVAEFLRSILAGELASSAGLAAPPTQLGPPGAVLLGGLAILVLSEVFAEGVRLHDDLEGTV
jgi:Protein of unknown function (DUF2975)